MRNTFITLLLVPLALISYSCTCSHTSQQPADVPDEPMIETEEAGDIDSILLTVDDAYFGEIGCLALAFAEDTLTYPSIPGLVHKSLLAKCPADNCFGEYVTMALHCPENQVLLDWMSGKVKAFADACPVGNTLAGATGKTKDIPFQSFHSTEAICSYYMDELGQVYKDWNCGGEGDPDTPNEQEGYLLADCWHHGQYYTFHEASWYDMMSCGDNTREAFITIDSKTGKELVLSDFVDEKDYDTLAELMMTRLQNRSRFFVGESYTYDEMDKDLLNILSGIGLVKEGLVITYYPYVLSSGADGHFHALIPYKELKGILKIS